LNDLPECIDYTAGVVRLITEPSNYASTMGTCLSHAHGPRWPLSCRIILSMLCLIVGSHFQLLSWTVNMSNFLLHRRSEWHPHCQWYNDKIYTVVQCAGEINSHDRGVLVRKTSRKMFLSFVAIAFSVVAEERHQSLHGTSSLGRRQRWTVGGERSFDFADTG
jgi:hypothetical protein